MNMLSKNVKETHHIAKVFLDKILKKKKGHEGALVVGLSGDLGAGKTAFTKAVGKHLGIKDKINSPTFVIMKKYPLKSKDYKFLFHLDAYRLTDEKELLQVSWGEIVGNKEHLVFVEWPENIEKAMPASTRYIHIKSNTDGHRNLKLT